MESSQQSDNHRTRAYIGLGSNEGDRVGFVQQAMQLLKDVPRITILECSSLYETEPVGEDFKNWFVNAVAAVETDLDAEELLDVCKDIEARLTELHALGMDRKRARAGGSRIIDLDILFFGNRVVESSYLTVPHPSLHRRAFALVPLLEIAPDLMHPGFGKTVMELHEELPEPELVFLYGTRGIDKGLE